MHADARDLSSNPTDLTPSGGTTEALGEAEVPVADPNDENHVRAAEDDLEGNGYTAAPIKSDDPNTTADFTSDLGTNADQHARPSLGEIGRATSELQSRGHLVCRLLLEKKNKLEKSQTQLYL